MSCCYGYPYYSLCCSPCYRTLCCYRTHSCCNPCNYLSLYNCGYGGCCSYRSTRTTRYYYPSCCGYSYRCCYPCC